MDTAGRASSVALTSKLNCCESISVFRSWANCIVHFHPKHCVGKPLSSGEIGIMMSSRLELGINMNWSRWFPGSPGQLPDLYLSLVKPRDGQLKNVCGMN